MQDKFSQDARGFLEYGSLNVFFGGLEAQVGSPSPKVWQMMAEEHTNRGDSNCTFTTINYSLTTNSSIEYKFVAEPDAPARGLQPVEDKIRRAERQRRGRGLRCDSSVREEARATAARRPGGHHGAGRQRHSEAWRAALDPQRGHRLAAIHGAIVRHPTQHNPQSTQLVTTDTPQRDALQCCTQVCQVQCRASRHQERGANPQELDDRALLPHGRCRRVHGRRQDVGAGQGDAVVF